MYPNTVRPSGVFSVIPCRAPKSVYTRFSGFSTPAEPRLHRQATRTIASAINNSRSFDPDSSLTSPVVKRWTFRGPKRIATLCECWLAFPTLRRSGDRILQLRLRTQNLSKQPKTDLRSARFGGGKREPRKLFAVGGGGGARRASESRLATAPRTDSRSPAYRNHGPGSRGVKPSL